MNQKTIKSSVNYTGIALHTGNKAKITFEPAPQNHGVEFIRTDLEGAPSIFADIEHVRGVTRGTTIGNGAITIHTVEHVLAVLMGFEIDNLIVKMDNNEPPVGDGSVTHFIEMIKRVGLIEQEEKKKFITITSPLWIDKDEVILVALPHESFRISFMLSYKETIIQDQLFALEITPETFENEISSCRTFCFYNEVEELMNQNLIKGGSLDNAVVVGQDAIFSKEDLRFPDECVRHKILDLLGDLFLLGRPIKGHIIAIKAGHGMNIELAKELAKHFLT
ncbi:UDP-3-O-acyl-N-acetylglucosamine deacetylase [Chlamydiota bacterium]